MAIIRFSLAISIFTLLFMFGFAGRPSKYPCPGDKRPHGEGVTCKEVKLPSGLCSACPLRPPLDDGRFRVCDDIFNADTDACKRELRKYVQANPCDPVRKAALEIFEKNRYDYSSRTTIDYFLYSVCEECCDCIPMGADRKKHKGLLVMDRGNCPAHALYDICAVLPHATHFVRIGETTNEFDKDSQKGCNLLHDWKKSPYFRNWETNPKTKIDPALDRFLKSLVNAADCSKNSIWEHCFDMEQKQNNLNRVGAFDGNGIRSDTGTKQMNENKPSHGKSETNTKKENIKIDRNNENASNMVSKGDRKSNGSDSSLENCDGTVKWGCLDWDSKLRKCHKHGKKCFPQKMESINEDAGQTQFENNCDGIVKWGCLNWDSKLKKCRKHGKKCFPNKCNNNNDGVCNA